VQGVADKYPPSAQNEKYAAESPPPKGENSMARVTPAPHVLKEADQFSPACANAAVARCCEACSRLFHAELAEGEDKLFPAHDAAKAYRNAMPPLSGYENIRDFIACTAHGMIIGAIYEDQGSKLLYAAQVALATLHREPSPKEPKAA
jgi:hypothetical protein